MLFLVKNEFFTILSFTKLKHFKLQARKAATASSIKVAVRYNVFVFF